MDHTELGFHAQMENIRSWSPRFEPRCIRNGRGLLTVLPERRFCSARHFALDLSCMQPKAQDDREVLDNEYDLALSHATVFLVSVYIS